MPKITLIGAGSTIFTRNVVGDILSYPELEDAVITLHDIDPVRLSTSEIVTQHAARARDAHPSITATTDLQAALEGADFVICTIQVGGYKPCTVTDFEIPRKYGLRQTIADTLGIGGIMRGLRTVPVLLDICRRMEDICPHALLINHVNPMAINTWAISRASSIRQVGLCHSVQGTAEQIAADLQISVEEISYICAGINHMAFYLRLEHHGKSLYPLLEQVIAEERVPDWNRVRYEVFRRLGYFVTESSEHFSEYVPWFIKRDRPDLIERFNIPLNEYLRRCEEQIAGWQSLKTDLESGKALPDAARSHEYTAQIIHSMQTGEACVVNGNVTNAGLIDNLPQDCCVEVPCLVDKNGIQPTKVGPIPPHLAALMQTNINVQALTVEAALTGRREHIYHAAMLDPHTASELDLDQIWSLVDDLITAHGDWLPVYH